jgi:hypothetical protein
MGISIPVCCVFRHIVATVTLDFIVVFDKIVAFDIVSVLAIPVVALLTSFPVT